MRRFIVKTRDPESSFTHENPRPTGEPPLGRPTSSTEIESLFSWLRAEVQIVKYGKVGLVFTMHEGQIVAIEKTTSVRGKFELRVDTNG